MDMIRVKKYFKTWDTKNLAAYVSLSNSFTYFYLLIINWFLKMKRNGKEMVNYIGYLYLDQLFPVLMT